MNEQERDFHKYAVWMRSVPGFYVQYDGKVDVWARDEEEAIDNAHHQLRRGSFPDRDRSMWRVEKVERVA